jgi:hypothetical protein
MLIPRNERDMKEEERNKERKFLLAVLRETKSLRHHTARLE